ncbi:MAG: glutamate synthase [Deltaproteobacteria bacterium]|nr:glutamate synthase [Deltaproteobacteria bacterium]
MAELVPFPLGRLVSRMFRELERQQKVFDLPERRFVRGVAGRDLSVDFHGHHASSPLGPAAGPHSQLAQNIVLGFLGGARIFELKTVQILDRLQIPRPCIDAETIGYNVEWSQELTLEQSLEEYVKASMLVDILVASGALKLQPGFEHVVFDMSVGYDLAGIRSDRVRAFLSGMLDARPIVDKLRREIPEPFARYRDLDFRTRISDSLTLSTFHGCPPDEIERIAGFLLEDVGVSTVVKLNPTLLGRVEARRILNDVLGYPDHIPDEAFDKDATWEQALGFVDRLGKRAAALGRGFGVKFTNTLVVENRRDFFPKTEKTMYLSGQPLHVLAMSLVGRFREAMGDRFLVSFSGGIDQKNFADAVSLGLVPVTVCTDLLRIGGYGRLQAYFKELDDKMRAVSANTIDEFARKTAKLDDVSAARLGNTRAYVARVLAEPRYRREATNKPPKKVGTHLHLFDCLTCDKCIPICPNDANFIYSLPDVKELPVLRATAGAGGAVEVRRDGSLGVHERHQIGNFADFCNECGHCDVHCPEAGGPYAVKPRFFGSRAQFEEHVGRDGFFLERDARVVRVLGRFGGKAYEAVLDGERARFRGEGFDITCDITDPSRDARGTLTGEVDLTYLMIMSLLARGVLEGADVNYVNA